MAANDTSDFDELAILAFQTVIVNTTIIETELEDNENSTEDTGGRTIKKTHRSLPRKRRKTFDTRGARLCMHRDYLGTSPVFDGSEFKKFFRISRSRFQRLIEDIGSTGNPFYVGKRGTPHSTGFEARVLLPLKTLAFGVPPHTFSDYFQMSETLARQCCSEFDDVMKFLYLEEYLRTPTSRDLQGIEELHRRVHGVSGMFGSLDCCHTHWKNCPKAWQGSFKGKEKAPSIVLEAACDYHLWFWHAAYGHAGTLNDLNILSFSPLLARFLDGTFEGVERDAGVVPFRIGSEQFEKMFLLVDGIYPAYSRFVKGISEPTTRGETLYTEWQESVRKDIERAFGVLQSLFQFMSRPIHLFKIQDIAKRVGTCIILHNMCVSDRVMGDVRAVYCPSHSTSELDIIDVETTAQQQSNEGAAQLQRTIEDFTRGRWVVLSDNEEHARLHEAIQSHICNSRS